jgi:hypothetical protein
VALSISLLRALVREEGREAPEETVRCRIVCLEVGFNGGELLLWYYITVNESGYVVK